MRGSIITAEKADQTAAIFRDLKYALPTHIKPMDTDSTAPMEREKMEWEKDMADTESNVPSRDRRG